ncbi:MAG TPA: hypothetical protein PKY59_21720 [Pyrinomonadaceae bacterium]|nr:hypothetical protein [Pyrinomonadaceae bacterium]
MIRAIALSLALLIGIGAIIPLATNYAEAGPRKHRKYKQKKNKYRKYSKAWWREYRKKKKRQQTIAARKRALRLQQLRLAKAAQENKETDPMTRPAFVKAAKKTEDTGEALLPTGDKAPEGWKKSQASSGELQFRVDDGNGSQIGSAAISVVGPAMGEESTNSRNKTLSGVPQASLRRTVIDRMIRENGWVVNDYQKEVNGKKVYVVVAQSQGANGGVQSRLFYFTEVEGRIYSVATNAQTQDAERLAEESEKVINSLQNRTRTVQQASKE